MTLDEMRQFDAVKTYKELEYAKQLVNELNKRIKKYSDDISSLSVVCNRLNGYSGTIDFLNKQNERLTKKVKQLYEGAEEQKQRIKRLEEAGDALKTAGYFGGWADAVNKWVKVKEGQP